MGGGAAMRAAAKIAGVGVLNTGLRGGVVPDHPISAAARKVARPVSAIAASSSTDSVKPAVAIDESSAEKSCWENDGWELAGGEEEILFGSGEPMPRVVFGGAPTLEEAEEATSELSVALEKLYLSSPDSTTGNEYSEKVVILSPPKHAIQAFKFLNESPAVQTVVASIACDANVWNAVLLNPALQDYIQSQKMSNSFSNMYCSVEEYSHHSDILGPKSPRCFDFSPQNGESNAEESHSNNVFVDVWRKLRGSVVDMMTNLSDFFQNFFGVQPNEKASANTDSSGSFLDKAPLAIVGLAVMVIIVVVMKRA